MTGPLLDVEFETVVLERADAGDKNCVFARWDVESHDHLGFVDLYVFQSLQSLKWSAETKKLPDLLSLG